jgi:hypothetical protein
LGAVPDLIVPSSVALIAGVFPSICGLRIGFHSAASFPRAKILLQLRLADDPIISLIGTADLILRFAIPSRKQEDDFVPTSPDVMRWVSLCVAHRLSYGVAMRSHGMILLQSSFCGFITMTIPAQ